MTPPHTTTAAAEELVLLLGNVALLERRILPLGTANASATRDRRGDINVPPELKKAPRQVENPVQAHYPEAVAPR